MPSHIFTRVGAWEESIETNRRSEETARANKTPDEILHAIDYQTYALLQLSRDAEARSAIERGEAEAARYERNAGAYALAAGGARYAIERGDWRRRRNSSRVPASSLTPTRSSTLPARSALPARATRRARVRTWPSSRGYATSSRRARTLLVRAGRGAAHRRAGLDRARAGQAAMALALMQQAADMEDASERRRSRRATSSRSASCSPKCSWN